MKILKIVGIVILSLFAVVLIIVSLLSPEAHMERSVVVNAPSTVVFQQVASFDKFNKWSPWTKMDPEAKQTIEGPTTGVGAKMSWDGPQTGKGSQWTVAFEENKRVKNAMAFEGMEGEIFAEFVLEEVQDGTKVTWKYDSDVTGTSFLNAAFSKLFYAFMLEGMLGDQYQQGLSDLKKLVENEPLPAQEATSADSTAVQD